MSRIIFRRLMICRSISMATKRMSEAEQNVLAPATSNIDSHLTTKVINELPASVHAKPFEELHIQSEECKEKHYDIGKFVDNLEPPLPIAFNLAAFVNRSESLQALVRLGVDLSSIERKPDAAKFLLNLDFELDMKNHIQFLHDNGIHADDLGTFVSKNPFIFKESLENLDIRINYLKSKKFNIDAISRIITKNPFVLSMDTIKIDSRLGFFQKQFSLSGYEVRYLAVKGPKLISFNFNKMIEKLFVIKEELGYSSDEMKTLLLAKPKIWMLGNRNLRERFYILHNIMKLSHERILEFPDVLLTREFILKQRHQYLEHVGRAQYDPTQPLYISLRDLATLTESAFCEKCAKTSVEHYNEFLKTI